MTLRSHLHELRRKHEALSDEVEQAQRSPAVNTLRITEMKRQKLRLKEQITRIEPEAYADA